MIGNNNRRILRQRFGKYLRSKTKNMEEVTVFNICVRTVRTRWSAEHDSSRPRVDWAILKQA